MQQAANLQPLDCSNSIIGVARVEQKVTLVFLFSTFKCFLGRTRFLRDVNTQPQCQLHCLSNNWNAHCWQAKTSSLQQFHSTRNSRWIPKVLSIRIEPGFAITKIQTPITYLVTVTGSSIIRYRFPPRKCTGRCRRTGWSQGSWARNL